MTIWEAFFNPPKTEKERYNFAPLTSPEVARRRVLEEIAVAELKQAEANRKTEPAAKIVVGGKYPSMYGHEPSSLKVTKLIRIRGNVLVHFITHRGVPDVRNMEMFCEKMADRIAYDENSLQSVDATELFAKYGLSSKEKSDGNS